ncbi:MAG: cellulase family glycosylhydrolase [Xanthobacteraceae bacterium]
MHYDDRLTEAEFTAFRPNGEVVRYLELTRKRLGLERRDMNVLDWGSGRGEYVAWLRDAGYNAFGAELRPGAADRGKEILEAHGHDFARVINIIPESAKTDLPANFFHFVFTHYVIEHVADLDAVAIEIARITTTGGCGFHVYPGKLRPIEPHLFMPLVHWLPKNVTRKWAIAACLACGIEPRWDWLSAANFGTKAQAYCDFAIKETFYRSFSEVRRSFEQVGFAVRPVASEHPTFAAVSALPSALKKFMVELPVRLFHTVEIIVSKPLPAQGPERSVMAADRKGATALFLLAATFVASWLLLHAAKAQETTPSQFRRGISISHIMAWAPVENASTRFLYPPFSYPIVRFTKELNELHRVGFDFVRFAVDPGPFLQWQGSKRDYLDRMLIASVRQIQSCGLSVIVDFHPSDMNPDYLAEKIAAGAEAPLFKEYVLLLARTAAALAALNSPAVALEIMNEPPPRATVWRPMLDAAYAAVRQSAPKLWLVLDGGEGGDLGGTTKLDGFESDHNILFSFHYYRPWQFTHQGLRGMAAQYLTDVPYPARARPIEESIEATAATIAGANLSPSEKEHAEVFTRTRLESYRASSFDRATIKQDFDKMTHWAREHSVPMQRVILGEFGAMNNEQRGLVIRQAERVHWFSDVREEAEAHGFVWAAWVYSGSVGFSLVKDPKSPELDPEMTQALGLE